jgi:hypothetical protein
MPIRVVRDQDRKKVDRRSYYSSMSYYVWGDTEYRSRVAELDDGRIDQLARGRRTGRNEADEIEHRQRQDEHEIVADQVRQAPQGLRVSDMSK